MHPDLSRHWPTEEYNVFINWLRECHKNYSIWEIFGHCNDPDQERRKCLNSEDTEKKTKSREYNNACKKDVFNPAEESEKQITGIPWEKNSDSWLCYECYDTSKIQSGE
ncbi:COX assembly mitochondrial protein 2 homolog [Panthera pardus]|uniref:COX assembly mitochondrial protein n=1 Tax=Panthera pardus TaxID=9691 RepID=A0A9V1FMV7_PANPR|nr:COX assembly mitochondrial protein 2 homolog [Panthera pardus]